MSLRKVLIIFSIILVVATPAFARDIVIETEAARIEGATEDDRVIILAAFTLTSDEYTLVAVSGRFQEAQEIMQAKGEPSRPAVLTFTGDSPFTVSATQRIDIALEEETLEAEGDVKYESDDTKATGHLLTVDGKERIWMMVEEDLARHPRREIRDIVLEFFERADDEDRLVLLKGSVHVERDDSQLDAAWVIFNESQEDEFVSVSDPDLPVNLRITRSDQ